VLARVQLDQIMALVDRHLGDAGYVCIDTEWADDERILRVFLDREQGIDLEACAQASRILNDIRDLDDLVSGPYTLEVSSPGIERPLRKLEDFRRFIGKRIAVKARQGSDIIDTMGRLDDVSDDGMIQFSSSHATASLSLSMVERANLVHDWGQSKH
jgi:ribosome maturation factor RimP